MASAVVSPCLLCSAPGVGVGTHIGAAAVSADVGIFFWLRGGGERERMYVCVRLSRCGLSFPRKHYYGAGLGYVVLWMPGHMAASVSGGVGVQCVKTRIMDTRAVVCMFAWVHSNLDRGYLLQQKSVPLWIPFILGHQPQRLHPATAAVCRCKLAPTPKRRQKKETRSSVAGACVFFFSLSFVDTHPLMHTVPQKRQTCICITIVIVASLNLQHSA